MDLGNLSIALSVMIADGTVFPLCIPCDRTLFKPICWVRPTPRGQYKSAEGYEKPLLTASKDSS